MERTGHKRTHQQSALRFEHSMVYDTVNAQVGPVRRSQFGGNPNGNLLAEQGCGWNELAQKVPRLTPKPRYGHSMAYDAARGRADMFGGFKRCILLLVRHIACGMERTGHQKSPMTVPSGGMRIQWLTMPSMHKWSCSRPKLH